MRKTTQSLVIFGLCLAVATAALAVTVNKRGTGMPVQQTVFRIDTPAEGATVFGIVEVRGYVVDPRGVAKITLTIDDAAVHDADLNQPRADLRRKYPGFEGEPFADAPGFVTSFLASNYASGDHQLSVEVTYTTGEVAVLGTRTVTIDNTQNQAPLGALDLPRDPAVTGGEDVISGVYPLTGWAIDDGGVRMTTGADGNPRADIDVMLDGRVIGQAVYGLARADVANAHPDVAAAFHSGWQMNLDSSKIDNGRHEITVRVWDAQGLNSIIGDQVVYVDNNYATLKPIGQINWPMPNGHFYSTACFNVNPPSGLEYSPGAHIDWVSGWVVDQNDQKALEGVVAVQLLLNGVQIKDTSEPYPSGCGPIYMATNVRVDVNCFGLDRPDIFYLYPQLTVDAKNSGFFFAVDTDYWLNRGNLRRGLNYLTVTARTLDPTRPAVVIDQIPIIVDCDVNGINPAYGELEQPAAMQDVQGSTLLKGWVIDMPLGVRRLNFYVDGILDGSLIAPNANLNMQRLDLETKYPWLPFPAVRSSGFQYTLDTTKYTDGVHQIVIEAVDYSSYANHNYWVQRPLVFNNLN